MKLETRNGERTRLVHSEPRPRGSHKRSKWSRDINISHDPNIQCKATELQPPLRMHQGQTTCCRRLADRPKPKYKTQPNCRRGACAPGSSHTSILVDLHFERAITNSRNTQHVPPWVKTPTDSGLSVPWTKSIMHG